MKRLCMLLLLGSMALSSSQIQGAGSSGVADTAVLDTSEAATLAFVWELHKYQRNRYVGGADCWKLPLLATLAREEQVQMDIFGNLLDHYGVALPSDPNGYWGYSDGFLTEELDIMSWVCWAMPPMVLEHSAHVEELAIQDLRLAIGQTDEQLLADAYAGALAGAYTHLRYLADSLGDAADYIAQVLSQQDVDAILAGTPPATDNPFEINAGLNDAWFYPKTAGQGFFVSVFPASSLVMVGWFTFDTTLPDGSLEAELGDPGQRWFTAQGTYAGNRAELTLYSSSSGLFDEAPPTPLTEEVGSLNLQFEDCNSGSVSYFFPGNNISGFIPIERVTSDNIAACEAFVQ